MRTLALVIGLVTIAGCARQRPVERADTPVVRAEPAGVVSIGAAEIVSYDPNTDSLLVTGEAGVWRVALPVGKATPTVIGLKLGDDEFGTSVAADPRGRGFGVVAVANDAQPPRPGRAVFFDIAAGEELFSVATGHHPDCVVFTPDGLRVITADEGEAKGEHDPPGGVTVIGLPGSEIARDRAHATTLTLDDPGEEPEYLAPFGTGAWVSVQESSLLRRVEFGSGEAVWGREVALGPRRVTIDASDDGRLTREHPVTALPQPDSIVIVPTQLGTVLVAANEGDPREGEDARDGTLDPASPTPRLEVGADPDRATYRLAFGTRDLSVHDAFTGNLLSTTGGDIEAVRDQLASGRGGPDAAMRLDTRSDNRGPEPEGLAASEHLPGLVFVGLERADAVLVFDVRVPTDPRLVHMIDLALADPPGAGPEGMAIFERGDDLCLAVACEGSGTVHLYIISGSARHR